MIKVFLLSAIILCSFGQSHAQRNISGKKGFINIPDASSDAASGDFAMGYVYNPMKYGLRKEGIWSEQILYTDIALTPRLNCTFLLLQARTGGKRIISQALGDRQFDLRYQILKEKKKQPGLTIVLSNPFTVDAAIGTQAIVAGKTFKINKSISSTFALGFGSPYYIKRNESNLNNYNALSKFILQDKKNDIYKSDYLTGFFGGVKVDFAKKGGIMVEWDSRKLNACGYMRLFDSLTLQVAALNMDGLTYGVSYTYNLNTQKK